MHPKATTAAAATSDRRLLEVRGGILDTAESTRKAVEAQVCRFDRRYLLDHFDLKRSRLTVYLPCRSPGSPLRPVRPGALQLALERVRSTRRLALAHPGGPRRAAAGGRRSRIRTVGRVVRRRRLIVVLHDGQRALRIVGDDEGSRRRGRQRWRRLRERRSDELIVSERAAVLRLRRWRQRLVARSAAASLQRRSALLAGVCRERESSARIDRIQRAEHVEPKAQLLD